MDFYEDFGIKSHDDSLPHVSPVPQPHAAMIYKKPSVPDLSVCDSSFVIESCNRLERRKQEVLPPQLQLQETKILPQKINLKQPRATKASLARKAVNQPVKNQIKSNQPMRQSTGSIKNHLPSSQRLKHKVAVAQPIKKQGRSNQPIGKSSQQTNDLISSEQSSNKNALHHHETFFPENVNKPKIGPNQDNEKVNQRNFQSYCPEDYSDLNLEDDESFLIESSLDKSKTDNSYEKAILASILRVDEDFKTNAELRHFIKDSIHNSPEESKIQTRQYQPLKIDPKSDSCFPPDFGNTNSVVPMKIHEPTSKKKFNWSLIDMENGSLLLDENKADKHFKDNISKENSHLSHMANPSPSSIDNNVKASSMLEISEIFEETLDACISNKDKNCNQNTEVQVLNKVETRNDSPSQTPSNLMETSGNNTKDTENTTADVNNSAGKFIELMLAQQKQLKELQKQVYDFLNYQKESSNQEKTERTQESTFNKELLEVQNKQQFQIEKLQEQLQLFLNDSPKKTSVREMATQSSFISKDDTMTVGVNTSIQWPPETDQQNNNQISNDHSKVSYCLQFKKNCSINTAYGIADDTCATKNQCQYCSHKQSLSLHERQHAEKVTANRNSVLGFSTTETSLHDSSFESNKTLNGESMSSSQTHVTPLKQVNISTFVNDSHDLSPSRNNQHFTNVSEWNRSPLLGESASILAEQEKNEYKQNIEEASPIMNDVDFCARVMEQVKSFIEAQEIVHNQDNSENKEVLEIEKAEDTNSFDGNEKSNCNSHVERASDKGKEMFSPKIIPTEPEEKSFIEHKWHKNVNVLQTVLPQINYVTMSLNDTFQDFSLPSDIDDIASKYLPANFKEKLPERKVLQEVTNKTVKFQGVYRYESKGKQQSTTASVNFSCNMSLASQKYLEKYQLQNPIGNSTNMNSKPMPSHPTITKPIDTPVRGKTKANKEIMNKENILDFKKLKSLQKLE